MSRRAAPKANTAARTREGHPVILDVLPALLARIEAAGLRSVTLPEGLKA